MGGDGLVIPDRCIRFPFMICVYLLQREALLEAGYALDLSGHQHRTIEQERWSTFLDDSDTFAVKVSMTGRRHTDLVASRKYNPALMPHIGMQHKRHLAPSNALEYPLESAMMIGMSMREDHGTQVILLHFEPVPVLTHSVAAQSGIIQHRFAAPFSLHGQQQRIAVFCDHLLA